MDGLIKTYEERLLVAELKSNECERLLQTKSPQLQREYGLQQQVNILNETLSTKEKKLEELSNKLLTQEHMLTESRHDLTSTRIELSEHKHLVSSLKSQMEEALWYKEM